MKTISRYIMTLLLLITAATGAWASGEIVVTVTAADLQADLSNPFTKNGVTIKCSDRMTGGLAFNELNEMSTTLGYFTKIEITNQFPEGISGINGINGFSVNGSVATWTGKASSVGLGNYSVGPVVQFVFTIEPAGIDVTYNDAKTEASFKMPQYDATASYTLKRDMSVDMAVTVQDAEQNSRFRVKKQDDTFVPVDMNMDQIVALFTVHDDIEQKNLTANTDFTVLLFAVDEEGQKTGEAIPFNDFTFAPGKYVATAVAAEGSNYSGTTTQSNVFELFQGYELTIAAGEYATFYKDEKLYVEDEDAVLYTVANVTDTEAQLSDAIKVAPAETPLLVYNKGEETKTFLLIPTTEQADDVTAADQFKGTLEAKDMPASSASTNYYGCTGKAFVWLKSAGKVAANRCWLEISTSEPNSARKIVSGGATGIDSMVNGQWSMDNYYDMQGRKVEKPVRGGIYIKNGKKVIVK